MIIIETTKGPVMVNDREVRGFQYDKGNGEVVVTFSYDMPERMILQHIEMVSQFEERTLTVKDVENVKYLSDQCQDTYEYQGSEIERLKAIVKKVISESTDLMVRCNKQSRIIEEYAFFLRRIAPLRNCDMATSDTLRKSLSEEQELLDKKVREYFPKFDVFLGRDEND